MELDFKPDACATCSAALPLVGARAAPPPDVRWRLCPTELGCDVIWGYAPRWGAARINLTPTRKVKDCLCLSACGSNEHSSPVEAKSPRTTASPRSTPLTHSEQEAGETDSGSSRAEDQEEVSDEDDHDEDSDIETKYFHGYRCIDDCGGHEAGYEWAEEHDIDDVDQCGGNSQSFIEGCQAWVEENY